MSDNNNIDIAREERTNLPEVVFARGKGDADLVAAIDKLLGTGRALVTKATPDQITLIGERFGDRVREAASGAGIVILAEEGGEPETIGRVAVIAAGSSDLSIAEEAALSARFFGLDVMSFHDCGVAGLHRVMPAIDAIKAGGVDAVIVIAGMEGTLPSVVSGLVRQPVIAVPTSVGYGTGLDGAAALLTMLNSCSPGIAVMNIDNGFGAAAFAYKCVKLGRD